MGLNLAIVIGIKDYDTQKQLKACQKDATNMNALLSATSKYDDILLINSDRVESIELKDKLPLFVQKYEGQKVDEIFLYYSGHGTIYNDEFVYVPTDYDGSKPNSTTYKNSEVDDLLRRLDPVLTVKVIDACHCGEHYVKDIDPYEKSIHATKGKFHNCYFFFSSHDYQTSVTDEVMGYFTRAWFETIESSKRAQVKYREFLDYIADKFQTNKKQIPYFVTQCTSLEEFCNKTPEVEKAIKDILSGKVTTASGIKENAASPLLEAIKADASNYRSDEQIHSLLEELQQQVSQFELNQDLKHILILNIEFIEGLSAFNKKSEVGEWLKKNAKSTYKATYEQTKMVEAKALFQPLTDYDPLDHVFSAIPEFPKYYVSGFSLDIVLPYNVIKLIFKSEYPNVCNYEGLITFVPSKTDLRFFYYLAKDSGTTTARFKPISQLATIPCLYKNDGEILDALKKIIGKFQQDILADLNTQFLDSSTGSQDV